MDNQKFEDLCKQKVAEYANDNYDQELINAISGGIINTEMVYIVWIAKVLQNNKALAALPFGDDMYYELTYNGDKDELYFDAYKKQENIRYSDVESQFPLG